MNDLISITVPREASALNRAADFFYNMASDLKGDIDTSNDKTPPLSGDIDNKDNVVVDATEKFGGKAINPHKSTETPPPPDSEQEQKSLPDIELDADGLPWDVRIHGAGKKKLAKEQTWKKIKNIEKNKPGLVAEVEAELFMMMKANPITETSSTTEDTNTQTPPPPVTKQAPPPPIKSVPALKYLYDGKEFTADQLRESGWSDDQIAGLPQVEAPTAVTFPELMAKVTNALTNGNLTQVAIDTALNAEGLASMPLLAARQDLVPKIFIALFPNG